MGEVGTAVESTAMDEVLRSAHNEKVAKEATYSSSASLRSAPSPTGEGSGNAGPYGNILARGAGFDGSRG